MNPKCCATDVDNVDMSSIQDLNLRLGCLRGWIDFITDDPTAPNFSIVFSRENAEKSFVAIKNLWEEDQIRLARGPRMTEGRQAV